MATTTLVTILILVLIIGRIGQVLAQPLKPCNHCDKGRTWDYRRKRFGEYCSGRRILGLFSLFSCGGVGKKLRLEIKLLQAFGLGRGYENPVKPKERW